LTHWAGVVRERAESGITAGAFCLRFLHQMETGLLQLNERRALVCGQRMA
jgi:hypothetical protein